MCPPSQPFQLASFSCFFRQFFSLLRPTDSPPSALGPLNSFVVSPTDILSESRRPCWSMALFSGSHLPYVGRIHYRSNPSGILPGYGPPAIIVVYDDGRSTSMIRRRNPLPTPPLFPNIALDKIKGVVLLWRMIRFVIKGLLIVVCYPFGNLTFKAPK
jgi:hypothetical protein